MSDVNADTSAGNAQHEENITREQELEASRKGWVPKHKFKGPEGQWKDAATFLSVGAKFNQNLQAELASVKAELEAFKGTAKQFADFQQKQIESRDAEIGNLMRDLKRQQREAIRDGDDAAADAIEDRLEILNDERSKSKQALEETKQNPNSKSPSAVIDDNGNTKDPVVLQWISEGNEWFHNSKPMRDYCFALANEAIASGETRRGRAFLDLMREKMEEAFPLKFQKSNDPTRRGSMTESGGNGSSGGNNYTVNDLPEADRELMKVGIRQGWTTEATFLKNYFSDEPHVHRTPEKKK
jgi:hypothetical protein